MKFTMTLDLDSEDLHNTIFWLQPFHGVIYLREREGRERVRYYARCFTYVISENFMRSF